MKTKNPNLIRTQLLLPPWRITALIRSKLLVSLAAAAVCGIGWGTAQNTTNFEGFTPGTVNYQGTGGTTTSPGGYTIPDPYGSLWTVADEWNFARAYDQEVKDDGTGNKVWRLSNGFTTGGFSDQPYSPSTTPAGESTAKLYNDRGNNHTAPVNPPNPRASAATPYFHGGFKFKSATGAAQPNLFLSVSPAPRQSNFRQGYVGIKDTGSGFDLQFYEALAGGAFPSLPTTVATNLSYTDWHHVEIFVKFKDGLNPDGTGNDLVHVALNGNLIHTGTSWETLVANTPATSPLAVDSLLFRAGGTAVPANLGQGLYLDDVAIDSTPAPAAFYPVQNITQNTGHPTIQAAIDGAVSGNTITVAPGSYTETANYGINNTNTGSGNPVGLLINKGVSIIGLDANGIPITSASTAVAEVVSGIQSNWGTNFFVTAPNVTIRGLKLLGGQSPGQPFVNKAIEVVEDNFTLDACVVDAAPGVPAIYGSVYINDLDVPAVFDPGTYISKIKKFDIKNNILRGSFSTTNGPGNGIDPGDLSMTVTGNLFENSPTSSVTNAGLYVTGNDDAIAWRNAPAVFPTITGNTFAVGIGGLLLARDDDPSRLPSAANVAAFVANNTLPSSAYVTDDIGGLRYAATPTNTTNNVRVHLGIQPALDSALDGDVVLVGPGTYAENIVVAKPVDIRGPNYGIAGHALRGPEAVVVPATSAISANEVFHVAASDVSIDGLTIDGDNPALTSGFLGTNGADLDAAEGVTVYETNINNLTVSHNIIRNLSYFGVTLYDYPAGSATAGHVISGNLIKDLGTYDTASGIEKWGGGVLLYNNQYTRVIDNVMQNVRLGVQTGNFFRASPTPAFVPVIAGNSIQTRRRGIFHNLHYGPATPYTLSNNVITGLSNPNETLATGILLSSLAVPSSSIDNTIDMSALTIPTSGYEVWNVNAASPAAISGGSVNGAATGLFLNNFEGYNSNAGDGAHATVSGLAITCPASGTGIRVLDSDSSTHAAVSLAIASGVTVAGGSRGLVVENSAASVVGVSDLALSGQTGNFIELIDNAGDIDATSVRFDGKIGSAMNLGELFDVESKVLHKNDDSALGLVTWLPAWTPTVVTISDAQQTPDLSIPSGTTVIVTPTGSLEVGQLNMADGSTLEVINGSLTINGSTLSGSFTFFNSMGSINFNDDVSITGSAEGLILISDVHVADGATITVDGTLVIDGSVVDCQDPSGSFTLQINDGATFTMARTVFVNGNLVVESADTAIYDNRFESSTIAVDAGASAARVFHNLTDDPAWLSGSAVTLIDGWGNVDDAADTENNLALGLDISSLTDGQTQDGDGNVYVRPGNLVTSSLDVSALQTEIAAVEVMLGYNTGLLATPGLVANANWDAQLASNFDDSTTIGLIDSAQGYTLTVDPSAGSNADQSIATVALTAGMIEGETLFFHRVKLASDVFGGETRLTTGGASPAFLTPFTSNSSMITIDGTVPLIADPTVYATIEQFNDDVNTVTTSTAVTIQGDVDITAAAFDALAGIEDAKAEVTLVGPATYTATQTGISAGPTIPTIGGDDYTTYAYTYTVDATTLNGTYNVVFTVTDRSGNQTVESLGSILINKNQVVVNVELEGLAAGPLNRDVVLVFTDIGGNLIETRTEAIEFTGGVGSVTLTDVDDASYRLSAKTAWNLRKRLDVELDSGGQAVVDFTGTNELPGGDINGDSQNVVNTLDYSVLRFHWFKDVTLVPAAAVCDINGDGVINATDYAILQSNFYQAGDPQ